MVNLASGEIFDDRYELINLLGRGGFSEVWLATDTKTNIKIALKVYAPGVGMDDDGVKLFMQEYSLVYNLKHPNLLRPSHFDDHNRMPYLVMPFCERGSAQKLIGKISEEQLWILLRDVAGGLSYIHSQDPPILHQDIKPDNILIDEQGNYLITDFGISTRIRSTLRRSAPQNESSGGTRAFMAPERFGADKRPVKANDIWSLGATLYELMCEDTPFGSDGGLLQHFGSEMPNIYADFSEDLRQVVYACLSKDTWERPTAEQLADYAQQRLRDKTIKFEHRTSRQLSEQQNNSQSCTRATPRKVVVEDSKINKNNRKQPISKLAWSVFVCGLFSIIIRLLPLYGFDSIIGNATYNELYISIFFIVIITLIFKLVNSNKTRIITVSLCSIFYWCFIIIHSYAGYVSHLQYQQEIVDSINKVEAKHKTEQDRIDTVEEEAIEEQEITSNEEIKRKWEEMFLENSTTVSMVYVEGGAFQMGSNDSEADSDEKPVHSVTLSSYYIGKYEVTQQQWQDVMGSNPSSSKSSSKPVTDVSWYDCVKFCNTLSRKASLSECYTINGDNVTMDINKNGYRLPTEAEWEFASRGGIKSLGYKYSGSNNPSDAGKNYEHQTYSVGQNSSNELGIYDMSGNVCEWCWDWYGDYSNNSHINPTGATSGSYRVDRGGRTNYTNEWICRSTDRHGHTPTLSISWLGLRLVRRP